MNIKEVHIDRHLDTLFAEVFGLEYLVYHNDLSISNGSNIIGFTYTLAVRYSEKEKHESHEEHRDYCQRV
jgi:hypothetical protein